jgi:hypothetical protein
VAPRGLGTRLVSRLGGRDSWVTQLLERTLNVVASLEKVPGAVAQGDVDVPQGVGQVLIGEIGMVCRKTAIMSVSLDIALAMVNRRTYV